MRRAAVLLALILVSCGDTAAVPGTTGPTAATATSAPASTEPPPTAVDTTAAPVVTEAPGGDVPDCMDVWAESVVQSIAGPEFAFFQANADRSACIYEAIPNSIALALRAGDLTNFEMGRTASAAAGTVTDVGVCDGAYYIELPGAGIIMEAFDADHGRVYTATIAGTDVADAPQWGEQLLGGACAG